MADHYVARPTPAEPTPRTAQKAPVVIVGTGPAGIRFAQELDKYATGTPMVIYGAEPGVRYSRVRLSMFVAAQLDWKTLTGDQELPAHVEVRSGCEVVAIDRKTRCVIDAAGRSQPYSRLVLAIGSRPFIPNIPGIDRAGIFVLRHLGHAEMLCARQVRTRRTAVLGGGLLGLESARAMMRFHTEVVVIEMADRLMPRQLDQGAAEQVKTSVEASGIEVILGDSVERVLGESFVTGLSLKSGRTVACDTLVVATGILPNSELARQAGLNVGRGIQVDEGLRTSDPDIYAIGECAEHPERRTVRVAGVRMYGAAAPALEQASIAAIAIAGREARYLGGAVATRLKVLDLPLFSMGRVREDTLLGARPWIFREPKVGIYRKLAIHRGKAVGAISIGEWSELGRVQEAVAKNRRIWPWQLWLFRRTGTPWPANNSASVTEWPATATVCNCTGITRGQLCKAIATGCATVEQLAARTSASTVCGSCRPLLAELVGGATPLKPALGYKTLMIAAVIAVALSLVALLAPPIPYPASMDLSWQWDQLWRDSFWKQVSGFTALGLAAVGLILLTLRKRWRRFALGQFAHWRLVHTLLGVAVVAVLVVHTGDRFGNQLNSLLMSSVLGLTSAGALISALVAVEHRVSGSFVRRLRTNAIWLHILFFWAMPLLLAFHITKTYYF